MLVGGVVPQQRTAHVLQVWMHRPLPEIERVGSLDGAELRQRRLVEGRADAMDDARVRRGSLETERIARLEEVRIQNRGWWSGNAERSTHISVALWLSGKRRGLPRCTQGPTSDERIIHGFDLRDGRMIMAIRTSGRRNGILLNESEPRGEPGAKGEAATPTSC